MMEHSIQRKAFTLIELLIVVAIISLLAAILFPVFARARENARRSSCMSNLKQLGMGVMMYKQDYDGYFPLPLRADSTTADPSRYDDDYLFWPNFIYPYVKSLQVLRCPSQPVGKSATSLASGNYGANDLVIANPATFPKAPFSDSILQNPAQTYLIMDAGTYLLSANKPTNPSGSKGYLPGTGQLGIPVWSGIESIYKDDFMTGRHFGGVNMAFTDGHVKWLPSQVVLNESKKTSSGSSPYGTTPKKYYPDTLSWQFGHWVPVNP